MTTKHATVWVYAKDAAEAEKRATGREEYGPWDNEEMAVKDAADPNCVWPGERLYRVEVETSITVTGLKVYAEPTS